MVARDSVIRWWCFRCHSMVSAPASRPDPSSCLRSRTTSWTVSGAVAPGLDFGAREWGSNAASPSVVNPASRQLRALVDGVLVGGHVDTRVTGEVDERVHVDGQVLLARVAHDRGTGVGHAHGDLPLVLDDEDPAGSSSGSSFPQYQSPSSRASQPST
jgi:hypothetical protein